MAPFEALYGRLCRSPVVWAEVGDSTFLGPNLVRETTRNVQLIRQRLKMARSTLKSYADHRRKPLTFLVRDSVFLKVSPRKGISHFGLKGVTPQFQLSELGM